MKNLNHHINFLERKATPALLPGSNKEALGWFERPFQQGWVTPFFRIMREKRWHFFSFSSPEIFVGFAPVYTGYLSHAFLYAYHWQNQELFELKETLPLSKSARIAASSLVGTSQFYSKNISISIENLGEEQGFFVTFAGLKGQLSGKVRLKVQAPPLINVREVAPQQIIYTHQHALLRPQGSISWNSKDYRLMPERDFSTMDYTIGHHCYVTSWNWLSAGGVSREGVALGINMAADIGEGSNEVAVFWIGDKIFRAPKAHFFYEQNDGEWIIHSEPEQGVAGFHISFRPQGKRHENINIFGVIKSRFWQFFGSFSGYLVTSHGERHYFDNMHGIAEEHWSKW